jgi:hypothetical protein
MLGHCGGKPAIAALGSGRRAGREPDGIAATVRAPKALEALRLCAEETT